MPPKNLVLKTPDDTTPELPPPPPGGILFQDNFDYQADWASNQPASGSGLSLLWPWCYYNNPNRRATPPTGYPSYRVSTSLFNPRGNDTLVISSEGARGGSGKGLTVNVEATSGYVSTGWTTGTLDVWLGLPGYQELYVRWWQKFPTDFTWCDYTCVNPSDGRLITTAQSKMCRISSLSDDPADCWQNPTVSKSPESFGSSDHNAPVFYPDWYWNHSLGEYAYCMVSGRAAPIPWADLGYNVNLTNMRCPTDGAWHSYTYYVKMNTPNGTANGEFKIWMDDELMGSRTNVIWKRAGSNSNGWNWVLFPDNWALSVDHTGPKKEQKTYIDDLVISSVWVSKDYVIP